MFANSPTSQRSRVEPTTGGLVSSSSSSTASADGNSVSDGCVGGARDDSVPTRRLATESLSFSRASSDVAAEAITAKRAGAFRAITSCLSVRLYEHSIDQVTACALLAIPCSGSRRILTSSSTRTRTRASAQSSRSFRVDDDSETSGASSERKAGGRACRGNEGKPISPTATSLPERLRTFAACGFSYNARTTSTGRVPSFESPRTKELTVLMTVG